MSPASDIYLITGACGFLGERISRLLLEEKRGLTELRLFDKKSRPEFIQSLQAAATQTRVSMIEGDIRDHELLRRACRGVSLVIHTAAIIDVVGTVDYGELHGVNVKGTQLLLEACIHESVPSFIYTSSIEVVGPNLSGDPIINGNEETPYCSDLTFPYGRTKREGEQLSLQANGELLQNGGRLATCALRPMYIYGEGSSFLLYHMRNGVRNGNILQRISRQTAIVNPVYVGNVAHAHLQAARALKDPEKREVIGGNFFFISDDTPPISYSDLNHAVMSSLGFGIQDKPVLPYPLLYFVSFLLELLQWLLCPFLRYTPSLNRNICIMGTTPFTFSYQKAKKCIGYTPQYSWEESRKRTTDWLASCVTAERERVMNHGLCP